MQLQGRSDLHRFSACSTHFVHQFDEQSRTQAAPTWQPTPTSQRRRPRPAAGRLPPATGQVRRPRPHSAFPASTRGRCSVSVKGGPRPGCCDPSLCLLLSCAVLCAAWSSGGAGSKFSNGVVAGVLVIPLVLTCAAALRLLRICSPTHAAACPAAAGYLHFVRLLALRLLCCPGPPLTPAVTLCRVQWHVDGSQAG